MKWICALSFYFLFPLSVSAIDSNLISSQDRRNAYADSMKIELEKAPGDTVLPRLYFEMGQHLWFSRSLEEAEQYLLRSIELAHLWDRQDILPNAMNMLANVYRVQEKYQETFDYLQMAQLSMKELGNDKFLGHVYQTYASTYYVLGDFATSVYYSLEAANHYRSLPDKKFNLQAVFAYQVASDALVKLSDPHKALNYLEQALEICRDLQNLTYKASTLSKMGHVYLQIGNSEKAEEVFKEVLVFYEKILAADLYVQAHIGLGKLDFQSKYYAGALDHFKLALAVATDPQLNNISDDIHTHIGNSYAGLSRWEEAIQWLNTAVKLSSASGDLDNLQRTYTALARVYENTGYLSLALENYKSAQFWKDSILNANVLSNAQNLEALYQLSKHENRIAQLEVIQLENDLELSRKKMQMQLGWGVTISLVIILILFIRNYRQKQLLARKTLEEKMKEKDIEVLEASISAQMEERSRIAKDLHDSVGSSLVAIRLHNHAGKHEIADKLLSGVIIEVRAISHHLQPVYL